MKSRPHPMADRNCESRKTARFANVIFRFVSRFVLGYAGSIDEYLRDLGKKLNQPVEIEA